jgi:gas vesicle protein
VQAVDAARIGFAAAVVVAAASLAAAAFARAPKRIVGVLAAVLAVGAVAAWVAVGFDPRIEVAVPAVGITLAFAAELASMKLQRLLAGSRRLEDQLARAEARLTSLVAREADEHAAELERTLARARADSASLLAEQERQLADEHRRGAEARQQEAGAALSEALAATQGQVMRRLQEWRDDLDRAQRSIPDEIARLEQRQRQLISDAEARIAADAERLEAESEQQREGLARLRDELARVIEESVAAGNQDLESFGTERQRALHELNDRIRGRERALTEQIEREETEAMRRIHATFADVERRQIERLERVVGRASASYSEAAGQQFSDAIRAAREGAAVRLSRELDRAVQSFAREAETVLAERLAHVGDAGAQRLEKRLDQITAGLERQQIGAIGTFEQRIAAAEQELRRRLDLLAADAEAERGILEARLQELARRIEDAIARI